MAPNIEYCIVIDSGLCYTTYEKWVERHFSDYVDDFKYAHSITDIKDNRIYKIIGHAEHDDFGTELYLIQDMDTKQVFIVEEEGIRKTTTVTVKNYTTTLRCDKLDTTISNNILSEERIKELFDEYAKEKEKKDMNNKIVDLYYERKVEEIKNKYVELLKNEYEELEVVKEYKELVNTFEASLAELANRHNTEENRVLIKTGYTDTYTYELNTELKDALKDAHREEYDAEIKALQLFVEEVRAVLSVSDEDGYRIGVLTEYGIINKKGKLNV